MKILDKPIRVLYSFPHKLGAGRICYVAWQVLNSLQVLDVKITAFPGVLHRGLPASIMVKPTLSLGRFRIPYRLLGSVRACAIHDAFVARRLRKLAGQVDVVHTWPLGALETLRTASELGIPTVLERCNAHTRFAYERVQEECERVGVSLPAGHEHAYKKDVLDREEAEYEAARCILCPSDFVADTFIAAGFPQAKLGRYHYGFDGAQCYPAREPRTSCQSLTMLFAAGCAPRKGLHYALEAWLKSPASRDGKFLIAGDFVPGYAAYLRTMLKHPSVQLIGYRHDLPEVMRQSDLFVLPSVEEGSALVTWDARGCGCVLLVSDATGAPCKNGETALVHHVGDVDTLTKHITMLYEDRALLQRLRSQSLCETPGMTWESSGPSLFRVYKGMVYPSSLSTASKPALN